MPINRVHVLKLWAAKAGRIHPTIIGNANPIKRLNSLSFFFEIEFFIVNLIRNLASMSHLSLSLIVDF